MKKLCGPEDSPCHKLDVRLSCLICEKLKLTDSETANIALLINSKINLANNTSWSNLKEDLPAENYFTSIIKEKATRIDKELDSYKYRSNRS